MEKLEQLANGSYKWNFTEGEIYPLWSSSFGQIFGEDAEGTYIGQINGYHVFAEKSQENFFYTYHTESENAIWMGEPDEGPYFPKVSVRSDGRITDQNVRKFIEDKLEILEKKKIERVMVY